MIKELVVGAAALLMTDIPITSEAQFKPLSWLEGCWTGIGFGAVVEECWIQGPSGRLTGMFQMLNEDGTQNFTEIFVLGLFDGKPAMRLKHFDTNLIGWEEGPEYVDFPVTALTPNTVTFEGLIYDYDSAGTLTVTLDVHTEAGIRQETIVYRRRD